MSDNDNLGFGKFVPGFDFLQNLAKGASQALPQMSNLSSWIAPTLDVEELEKRIGDLKAVHFWLDQNAKALGATIQALEVQKMTLATLQGMNFNMGDVADALKLKAADATEAAAPKVEPARKKLPAEPVETTSGAPAATPGIVDPLQWWGALTQQFQEIATNAMKSAASHTATPAPKAAKTVNTAKKTTPKRAAKKAAH